MMMKNYNNNKSDSNFEK